MILQRTFLLFIFVTLFFSCDSSIEKKSASNSEKLDLGIAPDNIKNPQTRETELPRARPSLLKNMQLIKGNTAYHIATVNGFPDKESIDLTGFGTFFIRGWAIDKPANTVAGGVIIQIGDKMYQASYGNPKPGVATKFNNPDLVNSEFSCRIPIKEIGKGKHTYSIKILTKDKKKYYSSGKREINIL